MKMKVCFGNPGHLTTISLVGIQQLGVLGQVNCDLLGCDLLNPKVLESANSPSRILLAPLWKVGIYIYTYIYICNLS